MDTCSPTARSWKKVRRAPGGGEPGARRIRAFTPGVFARESVFLHAEYKYLLALTDAGLYAEAFADMRRLLVPFLDPARYGRSTLESSA